VAVQIAGQPRVWQDRNSVGGTMRTFLKTLASLLLAFAAISVLAMPVLTRIELSTFLVIIGSAIATSVSAGILWMLTAVSESLDRLLQPQTQTPDLVKAEMASAPLSIVSGLSKQSANRK